jgi:protein-disulfide isomerase
MTSFARRFTLACAIAGLLGACHKNNASADLAQAPEMTLGDPHAKVSVVEYASDTCVHCARFNADVFPAFKAKYIDSGKVRYAFREFLTPPEPVSAAGFLVARCAGKDKYFQVVDAIFRAQPEMFAGGDAHGVLLRIARSAGLSEARFNACVQDESNLKALQDRVQRAEAVDHIESTPSFIVDGKPLQPGEKTLADLDAAIQPLLK